MTQTQQGYWTDPGNYDEDFYQELIADTSTQYNINNPKKLASVQVAMLSDAKTFEGVKFSITSYIDLSAHEWGVGESTFDGTLAGNGIYSISGLVLNIVSEDRENTGLFSNITENGSVLGINIKDAKVNGKNNVAVIAGASFGTVDGCFVIGDVEGTSNSVGGLIGKNVGTLKNSVYQGNVYGKSNIGGLVGSNDTVSASGIIEGCIFKEGSMVAAEESSLGGIAGSNNYGTETDSVTRAAPSNISAQIKNCYNYGSVIRIYNASGDLRKNTGGIIGSNNGSSVSVSDCINYGEVKGYEYNAGIAGWSSGTITNCANEGKNSAVTDYSYHSAGIVGMNNGTIDGCTNKSSDIYAQSNMAGIASKNNNGTLKNCVNSGNITSTYSYVGGLVSVFESGTL